MANGISKTKEADTLSTFWHWSTTTLQSWISREYRCIRNRFSLHAKPMICAWKGIDDNIWFSEGYFHSVLTWKITRWVQRTVLKDPWNWLHKVGWNSEKCFGILKKLKIILNCYIDNRWSLVLRQWFLCNLYLQVLCKLVMHLYSCWFWVLKQHLFPYLTL